MAALPPYHATIAPVTAAQLGRSWHPGCPVGPSQLRGLFVSYVGFDGRAHRGELVVNRAVRARSSDRLPRPLQRALPHAQDAAGLGLRRQRLPFDRGRQHVCVQLSLRRRRRARSAGRRTRTARRSTSTTSRTRTSKGDGSSRRPGTAYRDRSRVRPGMAVAGGVLVRAFASVGWLWGGRWAATPDYQHFSAAAGSLKGGRAQAPVACPRAGRPPRATGRRSASRRRARR